MFHSLLRSMLSVSLSTAVAFAGISAVATTAFADDAAPIDVVSIEEHWELHVGGPDENRSAPQATMVMSPTPNLQNDYFIVCLNHGTFPSYLAGGLEVQRWNGEDALVAVRGVDESSLSHDNETVTWTQRLALADGHLRFEIVDGNSQTWGSFGGENLKISIPTSLSRLNNYKPAISIGESGISYAGNRVSSLVLQKLRWTTSDGQEHELVAPIDIDTGLDP